MYSHMATYGQQHQGQAPEAPSRGVANSSPIPRALGKDAGSSRQPQACAVSVVST